MILKVRIISVEKASQNSSNEEEAVKNKLSVVNFTECENLFKYSYNIPENASLVYKKN
jgi:hypothetical protein